MFLSRELIIALKLKLFKTLISLIKMEWFKAFHVYINLENQFQILVFENSVLFYIPGLPNLEKKYIKYNKFLTM